jgi:hypothetical protein
MSDTYIGMDWESKIALDVVPRNKIGKMGGMMTGKEVNCRIKAISKRGQWTPEMIANALIKWKAKKVAAIDLVSEHGEGVTLAATEECTSQLCGTIEGFDRGKGKDGFAPDIKTADDLKSKIDEHWDADEDISDIVRHRLSDSGEPYSNDLAVPLVGNPELKTTVSEPGPMTPSEDVGCEKSDKSNTGKTTDSFNPDIPSKQFTATCKMLPNPSFRTKYAMDKASTAEPLTWWNITKARTQLKATGLERHIPDTLSGNYWMDSCKVDVDLITQNTELQGQF